MSTHVLSDSEMNALRNLVPIGPGTMPNQLAPYQPAQPAAPKPLAVHAAIVQVMDEVGREGVGKNHTADFGGAKRAYRGIDDIYNALNRAMVRAKIAIVPSVVEKTVERFAGAPNQYGKVTTTHVYSMVIDYKVICAIDSSFEIMRIFIEGFDTSDKGTGKAFSYAYKCGVLQLFCIPVEGQEDQDAHDPKIESQRPAPVPTLKDALNDRKAEIEARKSASERPDTRPARKVESKPETKPAVTVPTIGGRGPRKDELMSTLSDSEVIDNVRAKMHAAEDPKWTERMAPIIAAAKAYAATRGITDFSVSKAERAKQLAAAVKGNDHEYSDDMYLCENHGMYGTEPGMDDIDIRKWTNVEKLEEYMMWLKKTYQHPTQTGRIACVEKCWTKLIEDEKARAEKALAEKK